MVKKLVLTTKGPAVGGPASAAEADPQPKGAAVDKDDDLMELLQETAEEKVAETQAAADEAEESDAGAPDCEPALAHGHVECAAEGTGDAVSTENKTAESADGGAAAATAEATAAKKPALGKKMAKVQLKVSSAPKAVAAHAAKKASKKAAEGKKKDAAPKKDAGPKKPRAKTAYMFFCDAKRAEVRADMGNASLPEVARKLGEMWKALGAEDKAGYEAQAAESKKEAAAELKRMQDEGLLPADKAKKRKVAAPVEDTGASDAEVESDGGTPEESDTPDAPPALTQGQRRTIIDDDEEDDDHEPEDWGQVVPSAIVAHVEGPQGRRHVVRLDGEGFHEYVMHNPDKHPALPQAITAEYDAYLKAFQQEVKAHTLHGELDLDDIEEGSKLECCSFAGSMREKGFPLEEVRKGARQPPRLFPDDINVKVPMLGMSFLFQRVLDIERRGRREMEARAAKLEEEVAALEAKLKARQLVAGA